MNFTHHFLVSMPQMLDSCFRNSVVYILDHGEQGAFGVIINEALGMPFGSLLAQVNIPVKNEAHTDITVLRGGPVDEMHGLILHEPGPQFKTTRNFDNGVSLSSSRDVLEAIANGKGPADCLVVLGHSGWAPGQLEMEVAGNAWLTCEADTGVLFRTPRENRRSAVGRLLGIDLSYVVGDAGHA